MKKIILLTASCSFFCLYSAETDRPKKSLPQVLLQQNQKKNNSPRNSPGQTKKVDSLGDLGKAFKNQKEEYQKKQQSTDLPKTQ